MKCLVILVILIPLAVSAQITQRQKQTKPDPMSRAIRHDALSVAEEVIDQISEIEDLRSRVTLADKVVLLLGKSRPERLTRMLDKIFDDAMARKAESLRTKSQPEELDSILRRVIQIASRIDLALARRYIEASANIKAVKGADNDVSNPTLYLRIARELVRTNPSLAAEVAARSLTIGIVPETLLFLVSLRQTDIAATNQFFIRALQSWQTRGGKDINELLLLYSYVFSPLRVPTVVSQGLAILNIPGYSEVARTYEVDSAIAQQFIRVTTEILSNPVRLSAGHLEALTLGVAGDFYALTLLEPWVAIYQPNSTSFISVQRNTLVNFMGSSQRDAAFSSATLWKGLPMDRNSASADRESALDSLINRAESASDQKRKDQLYFRAALMAVSLKKHEKALNLVERISMDYSDRARKFVQFEIALFEIKNERFLEADKLARTDHVLVRRAYILTLIADTLTQERYRDPSRAFQYLDEVQQLSAKLTDEKERLSVLIGVGNVYARLDTVRASEVFQQVVKQANRAPDFAGDSSIANVLEIGGFYFDYSIYANGLTIFDLIKRLASVSYYATLQDTRLLQHRALRLNATLALCSAVIPEVELDSRVSGS